MRYTLTIRQEDYASLHGAVYSEPAKEGGAYLLCGRSITENECRFLVRRVVPVKSEDYLVREIDRLSIRSNSYVSIAKEALAENASVIFVHSHPTGVPDFSSQDNREDPKLHEFLAERVPGIPHGSMIISSPSTQPRIKGRVWVSSSWLPIERVRLVGSYFRFMDHAPDQEDIHEVFDRQVRAFGPDIQRLLKRLHVGIVGAGGTGSAVAEQLARLGVGKISIFDGDDFEVSNVNRVYGSRVSDAGRGKVNRLTEHIRSFGVETDVLSFSSHINTEDVAKALRDCDIVFGCTDKHLPRGILVRLALHYLIPVFDTGVVIDSEGGVVRGIYGRVTTLMPGTACLFCRERISPEQIALESRTPEERRALAAEGYAPELGIPNPAVITFTTGVASHAINELLHRFTDFMGSDRTSSETLMFFHESQIRTNSTPPKEDCGVCMKQAVWGKGDSRDFLGLTWAD